MKEGQHARKGHYFREDEEEYLSVLNNDKEAASRRCEGSSIPGGGNRKGLK